MKVLTKSKYILGLQCPRFLWISFNQPAKIRKASLADEFRFRQGDKVGELATKLYPGGIYLPLKYKENIEATKKALDKRKPLFEAGFEFNNCFSRADILVPVGKDQWDVIEVKGATKVKNVNVHDVSFQKYVYEGLGLKIRNYYLMHLSKDFVKKGKVDLKKLFVNEDITEKVNKASKDIEERIKEMFEFTAQKKAPKAGISLPNFVKEGSHNCLTEGCLDLPENHVFCLYRKGKITCELFDNGIEAIKDIPENVKLNVKQNIQRECEVKKKPYIDKDGISRFLKTLEYPLYYLDFETFQTAVPMFDDLKCYAQVPFQFSLHVAKQGTGKPEHYEFLYDGKGDPRKEFLAELKNVMGTKGSVIVYNQSFEIGRLKELAEFSPKDEKWVGGVINRIVDLYAPFKDFNYYHPKQQGSASIKKVLPALTGKNYDGMDIADGGTASVEFYNMAYGEGKNKEKVRKALLEYCKLDTFAEVMIVNKLVELVKD